MEADGLCFSARDPRCGMFCTSALWCTQFPEFDGATSNYDGSGRSASHNDMLYLFAWILF